MSPKEQEEFYVGYLPKASGGIAGVVRRAVIVLLTLAALVAVALVYGQHRFAASFFEFGNVREFEGVVREWPNPSLMVEQSAERRAVNSLTTPANVKGGTFDTSRINYALVAEGKHGARSLVAGLDGKTIKLRGTLIRRDATEMIEVVAGSVQVIDQNAAPPAVTEDLGQQTLTGEVVDSKCYLGVMNPGHTKPHRECASLCIRGGIPPLFVVKDADGSEVNLWLASETGGPINQQILDFVAEPIEITGQVKRSGDQLYLYTNPQSFRRR